MEGEDYLRFAALPPVLKVLHVSLFLPRRGSSSGRRPWGHEGRAWVLDTALAAQSVGDRGHDGDDVVGIGPGAKQIGGNEWIARSSSSLCR